MKHKRKKKGLVTWILIPTFLISGTAGAVTMLAKYPEKMPYIEIPFNRFLTKEDKEQMNKSNDKIVLKSLDNQREAVSLIDHGNYLAKLVMDTFQNKTLVESVQNGNKPQKLVNDFSDYAFEDVSNLIILTKQVEKGLKYPVLSSANLIGVASKVSSQEYTMELNYLSDEQGVFPIRIIFEEKSEGNGSITVQKQEKQDVSTRSLTKDHSTMTENEIQRTKNTLNRFYGMVSNEGVYRRYIEENAKSNLNRHLDNLVDFHGDKEVLKELFLLSEGKLSNTVVQEIEFYDYSKKFPETDVTISVVDKNNNIHTFILRIDRLTNKVVDLYPVLAKTKD